MKTIILVRHSEPQRTAGIPNDKIPLSEAGRILAKAFLLRKSLKVPMRILISFSESDGNGELLIGKNCC